MGAVLSDHSKDLAERDFAGAPSVSLDEVKRLLAKPGQCDGLVRPPSAPDESGALLVRVPIFSIERVAYFEQSGRARLVYLDRASQPAAHVPDAERVHAEPARQSAPQPRSQPGDAGPLFGGSPGCAAPQCEPAPARPAQPVQRLNLLCAKCGKPPEPGAIAIEGAAHYKRVQHGVGIPGRRDGFQARVCGKWVAAEKTA